MVDIIQGLIIVFVEVVCCRIIFQTFLPLRFPGKTWLNQTIILIMTILLTIPTVLLQGEYIMLRYAIVSVILAASMCLLCQGRVRLIALLAVGFYAVALAIDLGFLTALQYIMYGNIESLVVEPVIGILLGLLCKSILLLCVITIRKKFSQDEFADLPWNYEWIMFLLFPLVTIIAMFWFLTTEQDDGRTILLVSFGLNVAIFILFYLLQFFMKRTRQAEEARLMQERTRNQMEMYQSLETSFNEQRARVHEFENHMNCIRGLLVAGNVAGAMEYINRRKDEIEQLVDMYDTKNPIINAVINQKYRQAEKEGITTVFILDQLAEITIDDEDIVVLLSNLLNNAMEACQKVREDKRLLHFRFVRENEGIIIATKNPLEGEIKIIDDRIMSTKEDLEWHGIGLANIKKIVDKYGGDSVCSSRDGFFYHTIIFEGTGSKK